MEGETDVSKNLINRRELIRKWGPIALTGSALTVAGLTMRDRKGRHQNTEGAKPAILPDWRISPTTKGRVAIAGGSGPVERPGNRSGAILPPGPRASCFRAARR